MLCPRCNLILRKYGFNSKKVQRLKCIFCNKIYLAPQNKPFNNMRIDERYGFAVLQLLLEGMSIRSIERTLGIHRDTILNILEISGNKCNVLLKQKLNRIQVEDVQADEIWSFIYCKEKTRKLKD